MNNSQWIILQIINKLSNDLKLMIKNIVVPGCSNFYDCCEYTLFKKTLTYFDYWKQEKQFPGSGVVHDISTY